MQAEVLAGNTSFLSALLHISPTCLLSGLLLVCPRRPQEEFTSFPEGCGQNPRAPAGRKKRGALERPSVQRSAFPEVTLVGRGSFHVLIQFAREGIPKACRRLWLREFFFFICRNDKDVGARFSIPSLHPQQLENSQSPRTSRARKKQCPSLISLSCGGSPAQNSGDTWPLAVEDTRRC